MTTEILEGDAALAVDHVAHDVFPLPATGKQFALGRNPDVSGETGIGSAVAGAVAMLCSLDKATRDARNDESLSEVGRNRKLEGKRAETVAAIARHYANVTAEEFAIEAKHAALYEIPKLEPTDAVGALMDMEVRAWVRTLGGDERSKFIRGLGDAENSRALLALLRSPVDAGIPGEVAKDAWLKSVEATKPAEVAKVQAQRASVEWARIALTSCASIAAETARMNRGEVVRVLRAAKDLGPGAHAVYGIRDADWEMGLGVEVQR